MGAGKWSPELSQIPRPLWDATRPAKGHGEPPSRGRAWPHCEPFVTTFCLRNTSIVLVWELEMARGKKVIKLPGSPLPPSLPLCFVGVSQKPCSSGVLLLSFSVPQEKETKPSSIAGPLLTASGGIASLPFSSAIFRADDICWWGGKCQNGWRTK